MNRLGVQCRARLGPNHSGVAVDILVVLPPSIALTLRPVASDRKGAEKG